MADVKEEISLQANLVLLVVLKRRHPHLQNRRKHRFRVRSLEALNHGAENQTIMGYISIADRGTLVSI